MHELDRAIEIALDAHAGQIDKAGEPYFLHCNRIATLVRGIDEKIVAYLHDVVEKRKKWSLERLKAKGFSDSILSAVDALTKCDGEDDERFVRRAASNGLAGPVKDADLKDNIAQAQTSGLDTTRFTDGLKMLDAINGNSSPIVCVEWLQKMGNVPQGNRHFSVLSVGYFVIRIPLESSRGGASQARDIVSFGGR